MTTSTRTDLRTLLCLGPHLDERPPILSGKSIEELLMAALLRIRSREGRLIPMRLNPVQRQYARRCGGKNIVLKARQMGITTYIAARFYIRTITRRGTLSLQVAHTQRAAEDMFRIVHRFQENLPGRLRTGALRTSRKNVRKLAFKHLDSEYRVETADANAGRGATVQNLHCSEVARWKGDARETLAALRACVPAGGEMVLESTPNGAAGAFYEEWQKAGESGYVQHFYPWWDEPANSREPVDSAGLRAEEKQLIRQHGLSRGQIAYRREMKASYRGLAKQEYAEDPVTCFRTSGECVFDLEVVEARLRACFDPVEQRDNGRLHIWYPPTIGQSYVIGVDAAGGGSEGDYACAQVLRKSSGLQCAELRGHYSPAELARHVAQLGREYGQERGAALVIVERNNHGHAVLAHLANVERYPRLYERRGQLGVLTNAATRPQMLEQLAAMIVTSPEMFNSRRLLEECRTFLRDATGRAAAASGAHDDCVMAYAVGLWAM